MKKLLKIDEFLIGDHSYLTESDYCYFFGEYEPGENYSTITNDLVWNFKKKLSTKGTNQWQYKGVAIDKIIELFKSSHLGTFDLTKCTFIQIPPSFCKNDPNYDDRMIQVLNGVYPKGDVRDIILLKTNMNSFHSGLGHRAPATFANNINLDKKCCVNLKENIIIFDDVITSGSHFRASKDLILNNYPDKNVYGVFIARTVH